MAALRVLTWNLLHGRAVPGAGRDLFDEFADALGGWKWDVALLQEVPPWWPAALAGRLDADQRLVLTSRNALLAVRRAVAVRWPDVIKSNGGSANAILVRGERIVEHRAQTAVPGCRSDGGCTRCGSGTGCGWGTCTRRPIAAQGRRAAETLLGWAGGAPAVLGGDFNVRELELDGFVHAGGSGPDHVYVAGSLAPGGSTQVLERGGLSDHAPLLVSVMKLWP